MSTSIPLRPAARRLLKPSRIHHSPPSFLLPSLHLQTQQTTPFTTTSPTLYPRDNNRQRGVSTQRHTGLRQPVSVSKTPLPKPVLDASKRSKVEVDPEHGLYGFFHSKEKPLNTPEEDNEHGRAWCVEELRAKGWEDLHALWWVCAKERNRIATEAAERERLEAGYGNYESERRDVAVRMTQRAIKQVLTERFYSWRDAETIAKDDPEINLSGEGPVFTPSEYVDEDVEVDAEAEAAAEAEVKAENVPVEQLESLEKEGKPEQRTTTS